MLSQQSYNRIKIAILALVDSCPTELFNGAEIARRTGEPYAGVLEVLKQFSDPFAGPASIIYDHTGRRCGRAHSYCSTRREHVIRVQEQARPENQARHVELKEEVRNFEPLIQRQGCWLGVSWNNHSNGWTLVAGKRFQGKHVLGTRISGTMTDVLKRILQEQDSQVVDTRAA